MTPMQRDLLKFNKVLEPLFSYIHLNLLCLWVWVFAFCGGFCLIYFKRVYVFVHLLCLLGQLWLSRFLLALCSQSLAVSRYRLTAQVEGTATMSISRVCRFMKLIRMAHSSQFHSQQVEAREHSYVKVRYCFSSAASRTDCTDLHGKSKHTHADGHPRADILQFVHNPLPAPCLCNTVRNGVCLTVGYNFIDRL